MVGVYEYVVGALPLPFKLLIGFVGITGSKTKGLEMLTDDGKRGITTNMEARTAIALFLRREARYKEAIEVIRGLKARIRTITCFGWRKRTCARMRAREWGRWRAYREIIAANAKPGYFFRRGWSSVLWAG